MNRQLASAAALLALAIALCVAPPTYAEQYLTGTEVLQDIDTDTTWTRAGSPYYVTKIGGLCVLNGARLTIQAGVIVQFDHQRSLRVENGSLRVLGTATQMVRFTGTDAKRGWWGGIALGPGAAGSHIEFARFTYAGYRYAWLDRVLYAAISVVDVDATITDCTFEHNQRNAIELVNSSSHIVNSVFRDNGSTDSQQDIQCDADSRPSIRSNAFGTGQPRAIRVSAEALPDVQDNQFGGRAILVIGGRVDRSTTWQPQGAPYYEIEDDIIIAAPSGPTLTLPPGLDVRFQDHVALYVGTDAEPGALVADGSWSTIRLGRAQTGTARWAGIFFDVMADTVASSLRNVDISYGGRDTVWHEQVWNANVNAFRSNPLIQECEIHHSARHGIECAEGSPNIRYNNLYDNGTQDTHYDIMCDTESTPTIRHNTFGTGQAFALQISAAAMDDVRDNTFSTGRGVRIPGGTLNQNATWTDQGMDHYHVAGDLLVAGVGTPILTISPGLELRFSSTAELRVGSDSLPGALVADGEITFTRAADLGNWVGLMLDAACDTDQTRIRGVTIEYGGTGNAWHGETWYSNIGIYGCSPTIESCTLQHSARHGFQIRDSSARIVGNVMSDNGTSDAHYDVYCGEEARPIIAQNTFGPGHDKQTYAVRIAAQGIDQLRENTFSPHKGVRVLGGEIASSVRWTNQGMSHYYVQDSLVIAGPGTPILTLDPGLTLAFGFGKGLYVGSEALPGALVADGSSSPIVLTSLSASTNWGGLFVDSACDVSHTVLRALEIEHGGYTTTSWHGETPNASVNIWGASVVLHGCRITNSYRHGIRLTTANPTINSCVFADNGSQDAHHDILCDEESMPSIIGNTFEAGQEYAIKLSALAIDGLRDNDFGGDRAILVMGGVLATDSRWRFQNLAHYRVDTDVVVAGPTSPKLTIDPGNTLRFDQGTGLFIGTETEPGALSADGSQAPITFTRDLDKSYANWQGLFLGPDTNVAQTRLRNVTIEWGGATITDWNGSSWGANVNLDRTDVVIEDCTISNSRNHGLQLYRSSATIRNCTVMGSSQYGAYLTQSNAAIESCRFDENGSSMSYGDIRLNEGSNAIITDSDLISESKYGIECQDSSPLVAGSSTSNHDYGFYVKGEASRPRITGCQITDNDNGVYCMAGASPIIGGSLGAGNVIRRNTDYGIRNMSVRLCIDARYNEWDDPSGPSDLSASADDCAMATNAGTGNQVSDYVYYLDWVGAATHPPAPPSLHRPEDKGYVASNSPFLSVHNSSGSSAPMSYDFQLATKPDFSQNKETGTNIIEDIDTTSWQAPGPLPWGTQYYWRARAFDGLLYSYWMDTASFTCSLSTPTSTLTPTATRTPSPAPTRAWTPTATSTATVATTASPVPRMVSVPLLMKG